MFTELFGTEYRYSGAGVGYQVASVVGGGFTPFIAVALVSFAGGSWHPVAAYLAIGCLISVLVAAKMKTGRTYRLIPPANQGPLRRAGWLALRCHRRPVRAFE